MNAIMSAESFDAAYRSGIFIGPYTYEQYLKDCELANND